MRSLGFAKLSVINEETMRQRIVLWTLSLSLFIPGLAACETVRNAETRTVSISKDQNATIILDEMQASLNGIETDEIRGIAATEFTLALHAAGRDAQALETIRDAEQHISGITDPTASLKAQLAFAEAYAKIGAIEDAEAMIETAERLLNFVETDLGRADLQGKLVKARALAGDLKSALARTGEMPEASSTQSAFKARTYHDLAPLFSKAGDFETARRALSLATGMNYYQATAYTDVAYLARKSGQLDLANTLLRDASDGAAKEENGYFRAAIYRHIADVYSSNGDETLAFENFDQAASGARQANSAQEQARALSRIAVSMGDHGYFEQAIALLDEAKEISKDVEPGAFLHFVNYEIAGAYAFAGETEAAAALIENLSQDPMADAMSLKSAAQRDLAFGLARHGNTEQALRTALSIDTPRERIQALHRLILILHSPKLKAFARYP